MSPWRIAHLVASGLSLAASLLTLFPAPTLRLWQLSIGLTEYGHWLVPFTLMLVLAGWRGGWPGLAGAVMAGVAGILFFLPAFQAWRIAANLPQAMERAFGPLSVEATHRLPPAFALGTLWLGRATPGHEPQRLEFARHGDTSLSLDFYRSAGAGPSPTVVVIHGGGWNNGSPQEFMDFNRRLPQAGYAVAAIEYRLAPGSPWPAQREDTLDALKFLRAHAGELGLDANRFVLLGRSAGGQIAEALAYGARDPTIRGCIAFYAPADLDFAYRYSEPDDILNSRQLLVDYTGGTPDQVPAIYASGSAIALATTDSCPTLLLHGRNDPLVWNRQSERLDARLGELKVPHHFVEMGWATHGFDFNPTGPGGQLSAYAALYFLAKVTAPRPPGRSP
jgi:acetyl esterase/lipase